MSYLVTNRGSSEKIFCKCTLIMLLNFTVFLEVCNAESALDLPTPPGYEAIPLINAINGPVTSASFSLTSLASEGVCCFLCYLLRLVFARITWLFVVC